MFDSLFVLFYNDGVKYVLHYFKFEGTVRMQTINAIENNKYDPSLQLAFDLAETLGVKVDNLFLNEER